VDEVRNPLLITAQPLNRIPEKIHEILFDSSKDQFQSQCHIGSIFNALIEPSAPATCAQAMAGMRIKEHCFFHQRFLGMATSTDALVIHHPADQIP
jgi:hypothetical protein